MNKPLGYLCVFIIVCIFTTVTCAEEGITVTESGLAYKDLEIGTGDSAEAGRIAVIHFSGWIDNNGAKGERFLNSRDRGKPITFKIGTDKVILGWNIGIVGMKAGGKRRLMVPGELGYGARGVADLIPPDADLIFDIELLEVK